MTVNNTASWVNGRGNTVTVQHGVGGGGHSFTRTTVAVPGGKTWTGVNIEGHRTGLHVAGSQASQNALHNAVGAARGNGAAAVPQGNVNNVAPAAGALTPPPANAAIPALPNVAAAAANPDTSGLKTLAQNELSRIQQGVQNGTLGQGRAAQMTAHVNDLSAQLASGNVTADQAANLSNELNALSGRIFNRKQTNRIWQQGQNGQISQDQANAGIAQVHQSRQDIAAGNITAANAYQNLPV
jgi:hypothetical protein